MDPHRLAEERSRALHEAIADMLRAEPHRVEAAKERVRGWLRDGSVDRRYAEAWMSWLELPPGELRAALRDPGENARAMRQVTPFAGFVRPRERWRIWREVRERLTNPATGCR